MEEVTRNTEIADGRERKRVLRVDVIIPTYKPGKKVLQAFKDAFHADLSHRQNHCHEYREGLLE